MAVTAPASLSKIIAEFGGPNNLSAYIRGGSYVANTAANAAISTTVAGLAISQFVGAVNDGVVTLNAHTIIDDGDLGGAGLTGLAKFLLYNNGTAGKDGNNQTAALYSGEWLTGGTPGDYECIATTVTEPGSGIKTGTLSTWMALSTTRSWSYQKNPITRSSWVINVQIRKIGTTTILGNANITLSANGPGTSGNPCVVMGSWMDSFFRAEDMRIGMTMMTHRPEDGFSVQAVHAAHAPVWADCVRVVTESGATLRCSKGTPFNLRTAKIDKEEGHWRYVVDMEGEYVMVERDSKVEWERVVRVENIGLYLVVPLNFGGRSFAAGDKAEARIYSHNMAKTIP